MVLRNCTLTAQDDLYSILGCSRSAYQTDIRRAFRLWGLRYHPRKGGDADTFAKICNAWEILGNEDTKDKYDRYGLQGLSWDNGVSLSSPEATFSSFYRRFGGQDVVQSFLSTPSGSSWNGWQPQFNRLIDAMPQLQKGMSCCGECLPEGPVTPGAGTTQKMSYGDVDEGYGGGYVATPAPSSYGSFSSMASLPRVDSMKNKFMDDFRRKSGEEAGGGGRGGGGGGGGGGLCREASFASSSSSVQYYGMPCKDEALERYRSANSSMSSLSRKSSLQELREQQQGDSQLRSQWLEDFRGKLGSRGQSF